MQNQARSFRRFLEKNSRGLFYFLAGAMVSGVASGVIGSAITWSEALLLSAIIILSIVSVFVTVTTHNNTQSSLERMDISVRYLEEVYNKDHIPSYKGTIYNELSQLVAEAKSEILILGTPFSSPIHATSNHIARQEYLSTVENRGLKPNGTVSYAKAQKAPNVYYISS